MRDEYSSKQVKFRFFNQRINICYCSLFVILLLILSSITFPTPLSEPVDAGSYLIEFTLPPLLQTLSDDSRSIIFNTSFSVLLPKVTQIRQNISRFQHQAINQIKSITNQELNEQNLKQYHLLFNGIWINQLTDRSIHAIEQLSFVKRIEKDMIISVSNEINQPRSLSLISSKDEQINTTTLINDLSQYSGKNVSIAFFDTGIDYTHPDLSHVYQGGYDFVNNDSDPYDDQGHGTHVTGITAAQPPTMTSINQHVSGIASNSSVYAYKVLDENGEGYTSWFLSAFERAMDPNQDGNLSDHHDIISISAGNPKGSVSDLMSAAATQAVNAGITVIAAAGNNGPTMNTISSPAIAQKVIAVGASIQNTQVAPYSSRGSLSESTIKPDIIAPGHQITSTWPNNQYQTLSGTSMATPYVTGIVACLLEQNPNLTPLEIQKTLHINAHSLGYNASTEGYGLITTNQTFKLQPLKEVSIQSIQNINSEYLIINLSIPNIDSIINLSITLFSSEQQIPKLIKQLIQQTETRFTTINLPIQHLISGYYLLQINLTDQQYLFQLKQHVFIKNNNQTYINYPQIIPESTDFSCSINDFSQSPTPLFIFYVPLRSIQLKRGITVTFTAPSIPFSQKETRTAVLLTIIPQFPPKIEKHRITIVNTDHT